jgi:hypothetical protein
MLVRLVFASITNGRSLSEYSEDSRCTICQSRLYSNRYKCKGDIVSFVKPKLII